MDTIQTLLAGTEGAPLVLLVSLVLALWFLPALLALLFNRKHFRWILLACFPAGLSFIAWGGLLIWATTGKVAERYRRDQPRVCQQEQAN